MTSEGDDNGVGERAAGEVEGAGELVTIPAIFEEDDGSGDGEISWETPTVRILGPAPEGRWGQRRGKAGTVGGLRWTEMREHTEFMVAMDKLTRFVETGDGSDSLLLSVGEARTIISWIEELEG